MKQNRIHQRALSILLSLALVFSIFAIDTVGVFAASDDGRTTKMLDSDITITDSGRYVITQQDNGHPVTHTISVTSGTPDIELENVNINVSGTDDKCAFSIALGAAVTLTLIGTNTLVSGGGCAGLRVPASPDANTPDASLTITAQSTGSLNVTGAGYDNGNDIYVGGAGIGGGNNESGGNITINSGTITVNSNYGAGIGGGSSGNGTSDHGTISIRGGTVTANCGSFGAGIGGGCNGNGTGTSGTISISGGTVTANGGFNGAGIGGGQFGNGTDDQGIIKISGGLVTANGKYGGAGIGGGYAYSGGNLQISGANTEVTANGQEEGYDIGSGGGTIGALLVSDGATVVMQSNHNTDSRTIYTNCFIITHIGNETYNYYYGEYGNQESRRIVNASLIAEPDANGGLRLTAKATNGSSAVTTGSFTFAYSDQGTTHIEGANIDGTTGTASCVLDDLPTHGLTVLTAKYRDTTNTYDALTTIFYYSPDAIDLSAAGTSGFGYTYDTDTDADPGAITLKQNGWYVFTGSTTSKKIKVSNGISACVTLDHASIDVHGDDDRCAFSLDPGAAVNLILKNDNTLVSGGKCAGLRVPASPNTGTPDASLTITGQSTDSLNATGAGYISGNGSGLVGGAGIGGSNHESGGQITINGGTVTATGGEFGSGIGGGNGYNGNIDNIMGGDGGNIVISGGAVTAQSGDCGAGIGGGFDGNGTADGGQISISGGTVTANGGTLYSAGGAGIGGGQWGNGTGNQGAIKISGGTVTATCSSPYSTGAGIGGGYNGTGGTVQINGADTKITALGGSGSHDIGSGYNDTGHSLNGGTLSVAGTDLDHGPQVKLQLNGIDATKPDGITNQFTNCKIWGTGAKSTSNPDISGRYDANGKIRLSVDLSAAPKHPGSTAFGTPVTLTANIARVGFTGTPTLSGKLLFLCDGQAIGTPVSLTSGAASVDWTPSDASEHQLTVQYQATNSEVYALHPEDVTPCPYSAGKAALTVKTPPTASQIPSGSKLSASALTGGAVTDANGTEILGTFAWAHPDTAVTASGNYEAIFTPNDGTNYNTALASVPVTVTAPPTPTPSSGNSNSSGTTVSALPSGVTDAVSNTQADISGATMPSEVTSVTLSVTPEAANGTPTMPGTTGGIADPQGATVFHLAVSTPSLSIIGTPVLYNIKLLDQNGNPITGFSGTVTVRIPVPAGLHGAPHVFRYEESNGTFTDMSAVVENGFLVFSTEHFSYYTVASVGNSIALDTRSYQMPVKGQYQVGLKLTGDKAASVKVTSTNGKIAAAIRLKNGNIQVTAKGTGTAYIMIDVYDSKNHLLSHASVKIDVKTGIRPRGDSTRQIGIF